MRIADNHLKIRFILLPNFYDFNKSHGHVEHSIYLIHTSETLIRLVWLNDCMGRGSMGKGWFPYVNRSFLTLVGSSTDLCSKFCVKYDILRWWENLSSMKSCLPSDDDKKILLMEHLPFSFPFNVYGLLSEHLVCNPFLHDLIIHFHKGSSNIWYLRTLY